MSKKTIIKECIEHVEKILEIINPGKPWWIAYGRIEDQSFRLTDWQRQYHKVTGGSEEYIFVWEMNKDGGPDSLLYVINVSGESAIWTLTELFELLGRKF